MTDLSVIVTTCNRPSRLAACLHQLETQRVPGLAVEIIVVDESDEADNSHTVRQFSVTKYLPKERQRNFGAYARDHGIAHAAGRYVYCCDDDNIYYPHALATVFAAAYGHDIGVVRANHRAKDGTYRVIPEAWNGTFVFKDIDTMCACVRTALATEHPWAPREIAGADYAWLKKLENAGATINFVPIIVGMHC
jgi:glycosyltransferase involved in cell wall biosynthesis